MSLFPSAADRPVVLGVLTVLALFAGWWTTSYQPRVRALAAGVAELEAQRELNREARLQMIQLGAPGAQEAIRQAQLAVRSLSDRVPSSREAGAAAPVSAAVTAAAALHRVRVHALDPIADAAEDPFVVHGLRVQAAGRYHDVGSFLTELLSQRRITQLRAARLDVVPDSTTAAVLAESSAPEPGASARRRRQPLSPVGGVPPDEAPFTTVATVTLAWFSLGAAAAGSAPAASPDPSPDAGIPLNPF